jgi:hypothetical protein
VNQPGSLRNLEYHTAHPVLSLDLLGREVGVAADVDPHDRLPQTFMDRKLKVERTGGLGFFHIHPDVCVSIFIIKVFDLVRAALDNGIGHVVLRPDQEGVPERA